MGAEATSAEQASLRSRTSVPRIVALDGLRGVAALLVLLTHALLASIAYAAYAPRAFVVWAGNDAVTVFFVLSGLVLLLPLTAGGMKLRSYYPSRAARLYPPVWGAIILAAVLHAATNWHQISGASLWLNGHGVSLTAREAARDATLFKAGGFAYMDSLWSLRWEVIFSLLLPAYVLLGRATRQISLLAAAAALALIASEASSYFRYLPVFLLGTLMAFHVADLRKGWDSMNRLAHFAIAITVVVLCCAGAWAPVGSENGGIGPMIETIGVAGIVAIAVASPGFDRFLTQPSVKWLGSRSYALYLVQEPIVVSIAFLMGGRPNTILYLAISLPVAMLAGDAFFRAVERPSHRFSQRVRRRWT